MMDERFSGYDMLSFYTGMFNELDGNPDTLKQLQANFTDDCNDIIDAICELEGGKAKYVQEIVRDDENTQFTQIYTRLHHVLEFGCKTIPV